MAWFDIVGGVAQGAQQGLGQLQADLQLRKENALKSAADKRAEAQLRLQQQEEARQARLQREREIAEQISRQDPLNLDPEWVTTQLSPEEAKSFVRKNPQGGFAAKEAPLTALLRRTQEASATDALADSSIKQTERETRGEKTRRELAAIRRWNTPTEFSKLNDADKIWVGQMAGADPQAVLARLSPAGRQAFINAMPGVATANAQGAWNLKTAEASMERAKLAATTDLEVAKIREAGDNQQQQVRVLSEMANRILTEGFAKTPEEAAQKAVQAFLETRRLLVAALPQAGPAAPAASSLSPEQSSRAAALLAELEGRK